MARHMRKMSESMLDLTVAQHNEELSLVAQARAGERDAFDVLFQRHKPFIYNVCYRMLGSAEDAIDATQSAFIQAYRGLNSFRGDASFRSWLYRIAVNLSTSMLRQGIRRGEVQLEMEYPYHEDSGNDRVWEALHDLIPDLKAALVLFYFQGLSCREMAHAMGCSEGAVRTRLHRARIAFKKKYVELET